MNAPAPRGIGGHGSERSEYHGVEFVLRRSQRLRHPRLRMTPSGLRDRLHKIARRFGRPRGITAPKAEGDSRPVFLSFRDEDTHVEAKRLCRALEERLRGQVFFDFLFDPVDWVGDLIETVRGSRVVLVLIGTKWIDLLAERRASGRTFSDPVHIELLAALRHDVPLLAVLIGDVSLPTPSSLPPELSALAQVPSVRMRDSYWQRDVETLVEAIERHRVAV